MDGIIRLSEAQRKQQKSCVPFSSRHHRVHPDGAMIDSYKQANKTLPAAEEEGSHTNGGLPRPQRLFASLRRTAIFPSHFQARVRIFGLGDISPDATSGARPKNSGAGPNVAANHAPAGINPAVSESGAVNNHNNHNRCHPPLAPPLAQSPPSGSSRWGAD